MNILKTFGSYTFPSTQISYSDNFANALSRVTRMIGTDGGLNEYRLGRTPSEVGTIRADFWVHFDSLSEATYQIQQFRQIRDLGTQVLYMQPTDLSQGQRWCWANVNSIQTSQNAGDRPHKRQQVTVTFSVADPFWYTAGTGVVWGGGWKWGDGTLWGGGSATATSSGALTLTCTNNGNAYTLPHITIRATADINRIRIRRTVDHVVKDEILYDGLLGSWYELHIDCLAQKVFTWNAILCLKESAYSDLTPNHPQWLRLLPGSNTVEFLLNDTDETANIRVDYPERFV